METMTTEEIKEYFVKYVNLHSNAVDEGCSKKANQYHKKILNLYHLAKEQNCIKEVFEDFLNNSDEAIRLWAAGFCLKLCPTLSEKVLINITKSSDPFRSISAQATLEFYKTGQWDKIVN